ncbi:MAG: signal recognition particle-docking protein FtsY [Phycisphaerae bacterium]|nr:signal recognition particle-docking protein FtsY [Tepidisphaeraceae bacterium]
MSIFAKAFDKLKGALKKTARILNTDVRTLFIPGRQINEDFLVEVEEKLLQADVGVKNAERIVATMRERWRLGKIKNADQCLAIIREEMLGGWGNLDRALKFAPTGPTVILVAGVNGAGKTTSIAKLASYLKNELNKKVMVAAGDTFRAGAVHQLSIWAERLGVEIVKHKQNSDAAAVAYDACEAAKTRNMDVLIVDTAGRLPTQEHLIRELVKIRDVVAKRIDGAPHESLLVLDATTGQNAINQANTFGNAISVSGIFLAKLDGTAKGGVIMSIRDQLGLPVKFIGLGETPDDIAPFDPEQYVAALLGDGKA